MKKEEAGLEILRTMVTSAMHTINPELDRQTVREHVSVAMAILQDALDLEIALGVSGAINNEVGFIYSVDLR